MYNIVFLCVAAAMVLMGATVLHSTRTTQWGPINAARQPELPSTAIIRKIADLENGIAAVLAFIEEREGSRSPDCPGGQLLWAKRGDHFVRIFRARVAR